KTYHPYRYKNPEELTGAIDVDTEDAVIATLGLDDDVVCQWSTTTAAPGQGYDAKVLYGEEGSITFHGDNAGIKTRSEETSEDDLIAEHQAQLSDDERQLMFPNGVTETVATELYEFTQAILNGGDIETDGMVGYQALAICFAIYESSHLGQQVSLDDVEALKYDGYQKELNDGLGI
ncbi:MAG: Gfo/Idh/MocA family oxidoreductase, partial [Candidatus Latescibacteria bacterium]|nr:Gfo/Idh/MocA family oxidoreductase [Candidatus Latescibacterota bacterium]